MKMASYVTGLNPTILKWAREKAGYTLEDVARSLKKDVEVVQLWEAGDGFPTYNQLEKLAYSLYKRPIALFFFPAPPQEPEPGQSFRTLPDLEIKNLMPDTRHAIRQAHAMRIGLYELNDGVNPSERRILQDLKIGHSFEVRTAAMQIRKYLGVSLGAQFEWKTVDDALRTWRDVIQDCGIFVFKRAFKQNDVSGFCLFDDEFPVVYLNNSTAKTRQIFSLFHELAHLLLSTSGVTKQNDRYIDSLVGNSRDIEVFCNRLAAEFLVPSEDFDLRLDPSVPVEQLVEALAEKYKVSREVILRKLLDRHMISQSYYESKTTEWLEEYQKWRARRGSGGDYYATQATYLGEKFLNLAFSRYYEGRCNREQLADYLSLKVKSVDGLEQFMMQRVST
jgi:Zn-dependent peptidase ImmA (M78 family)/transcriptional regulator with XRE-family HTH domain